MTERQTGRERAETIKQKQPKSYYTIQNCP